MLLFVYQVGCLRFSGIVIRSCRPLCITASDQFNLAFRCVTSDVILSSNQNCPFALEVATVFQAVRFEVLKPALRCGLKCHRVIGS